MTTAAQTEHPPSDGWTTDDLDTLPEDGLRRELLDGVLLVSPSPTSVHQIIAGRLMVALERSCPPEYEVTQGVEIRMGRRRSLIPDVLVTTDEAARRGGGWYTPQEVVLAVEIVSPTSVSMDRITKPALYAAAGIPCFWRIETDGGLSVHAHLLEPTAMVYEPAGTFKQAVKLDQPWRIELPLAELTPRHLRP